MGVAQRLSDVIRARGIKQSWLAAEAGVPAETLSRIVTGTTRNPGVDTLRKIADALGVSVGALLGEVYDPSVALTPEQSRLITRFDALSRQDRIQLEELLQLITDAIRSSPASASDGSPKIPETFRSAEPYTPRESTPDQLVPDLNALDLGDDDDERQKQLGSAQGRYHHGGSGGGR